MAHAQISRRVYELPICRCQAGSKGVRLKYLCIIGGATMPSARTQPCGGTRCHLTCWTLLALAVLCTSGAQSRGDELDHSDPIRSATRAIGDLIFYEKSNATLYKKGGGPPPSRCPAAVI